MNTAGSMQHTSKQFHVRIMKRFRQQFKIAIITQSDGCTQIIINFANQISSKKPPQAGRAYKMREIITAQKTENRVCRSEGGCTSTSTCDVQNVSVKRPLLFSSISPRKTIKFAQKFQ